MKVIIKFSFKDQYYFRWIEDIITRQEEQGYINITRHDKGHYEVNEKGIYQFTILKEWIERIIEE